MAPGVKKGYSLAGSKHSTLSLWAAGLPGVHANLVDALGRAPAVGAGRHREIQLLSVNQKRKDHDTTPPILASVSLLSSASAMASMSLSWRTVKLLPEITTWPVWPL